MKAAIFQGPGAVEAGERPDPVIQEPTDAVVRVVLGCVCGSDLWYYGASHPTRPGRSVTSSSASSSRPALTCAT
jgi:threonine dehydrogenase-like Zn-dependent dehydrogenase